MFFSKICGNFVNQLHDTTKKGSIREDIPSEPLDLFTRRPGLKESMNSSDN